MQTAWKAASPKGAAFAVRARAKARARERAGPAVCYDARGFVGLTIDLDALWAEVDALPERDDDVADE